MKTKQIQKINVSFISVLMLLSTVMVFSVLPTASAETDDTIEIYTIEDLDAVRNNLNANYVLMNDLDFNCDDSYDNPDNKAGFITGSGWEPIGDRYYDGGWITNPFIGTFNGQNYTISNLFIDRSDTGVGLFGYTDGATLSNVGLVDVDVTGGRTQTGGLVGYMIGSSVSDSYSTGDVTGESRVGGLIGDMSGSSVVRGSYATGHVTGEYYYVGSLIGWMTDSSVVSGSYATGDVTATHNVGGLIGRMTDSSVDNSYATGHVTGEYYYVGGLIGWMTDSSVVSGSYATGDVTATDNVGGLIGGMESSSVSNSYATGNITGHDGYVGGLIGLMGGSSVDNSYATGNVTGNHEYVGGLIGAMGGSSVSNSYATGDVTGNNSVGGLIGYTEGGSVSNSYSTGDVTGNNSVGGLIGRNQDGSVSNSYSTGNVTGNTGVGGLIGGNWGGSVSNSFWDTNTSGQNSSDGGTGKTTAEMQNFETFNNSSWDIAKIQDYKNETWFIDDGNDYPRLGWEYKHASVNSPPVFSSPNPADNSVNQPLLLTWSITINDPEGDLFDWSIECSNGQNISDTGDTNGTKQLSLSGLDYNTEYTVWVNATDIHDAETQKYYKFTTKDESIPQPMLKVNINTGFGLLLNKISASVENTGDADATNVNLSLSVVYGFLQKQAKENIETDSLSPDDDLYVEIDELRGFGFIDVTATAFSDETETVTEELTGFIIGRFIFITGGS